MVYLLAAIGFNVGMTFVMRYSESHSGNRYGVTIFNYLTGVIISLVMLKGRAVFAGGGGFTLALAVPNALLFVGCLLLLQHNIKKNGAPLTSTFNRLGILIPTILSAFLFHEIPSALKTAGLCLAIFSIIYMNGGQEEGGKRLDKSLLLLFLAGGCVDMMSKLYGIYGRAELQENFILYTFFISLLLSIGLCVRDKKRISVQDMIAGVLVGIPNQLTALCLLKAVALLPAYMVFPVYSAAVILLVNVINFAVFREKLSRREYAATGIIAAALVLINI